MGEMMKIAKKYGKVKKIKMDEGKSQKLNYFY